jgi:hypothetical protein
VNRNIIRRWINEYLDGEIGLADKAELERLMAQDPALRKEYKDLRKIGLHLGAMPEVQVHPYRFRRRVLAAVDSQRGYFTPQRAFAGAMLVFLIVITVTFGLFVYQQRMGMGKEFVASTSELNAATASLTDYRFDLVTNVSAADFFNRLALESQLGMRDRDLLSVFVTQTSVFEGAVCNPDGGMRPVTFANRLPLSLIVRVTPQQALGLAAIAGELAGSRLAPGATSSQGETIDLRTYIAMHPGADLIPLQVVFK